MLESRGTTETQDQHPATTPPAGRPALPAPAHAAPFPLPSLSLQIRSYSLDKWRLSFLQRTYHLGEQLIILGSGALPCLWSASARAAPALAARGEPAGAAAFAAAWLLASAALELPWSAYSTFVVVRRRGVLCNVVRGGTL